MLLILGPNLEEIRADFMEKGLAAMDTVVNPRKYKHSMAKHFHNIPPRLAKLWQDYETSMEAVHEYAAMDNLYQQFLEDLNDGR